MPTSSLSQTATFSSNVIINNINTTSTKLSEHLEITSNLIEKEVSKLQSKINFSKGAKIIQFVQPTIIDNGVVVQPTLIDEKYVYVFNSVGSNNSIRFPQNAKASVLVVGGGGAGAPNIGGGGSGGSVIIGEDLEIIGNETFPIIVGKGGSGSNVQDGEDSYAFGAVAKGGKSGTTLVINQNGSTIGGEGGNLVESYSINTDIVFKENKYRTGLKNSNRKSAIALDLGYSTIVDPDLFINLKFDGDLTDGSSNSLTVTPYGNPTFDSTIVKYGSKSIYFNGLQYLSIPARNFGIFDGLTFATWVYFTENRSYERIFDFSNAGTNNIILSRQSTNNNLYLEVRNGSNINQYIYNTVIVNNTWMHVCVSLNKNPAQWKVYFNGVLKTQDSILGTVFFPNDVSLANCYIGRSAWADPYFKGYMDDFRIYKRAITAAEVTKVYNGETLVSSTTTITNTTTNTISYTYFAGGGSGAGSEAVEAEINVYPDGGSGVTNSYIIKNEFGKGGGGGSSSSYGYGGGRGTGQNANINQTDALSGTGNGGGGGKKGSAIGGSGGSGFVAVIWDKTDTVQLSDEDELNMSNYISTMKSNINDSLTSLSNYIVNELETSSNHISNLDYIVDNHPNLFSDKMLHGSSNKFITNNTWNDSLVIDGILYTSNMRIVGSNITQYVEAFEISDLSIVSTAEDLDAVTISHSGIGSNNLLSTYVANTPALIITSEGNIGIGTTTPSSKIEVVGNINISGNILPTSNEVYDIGSSNIKIRDLYLSQATIHMGTNTKISASLEDGGQFTVKDNTGNLKGVTASSFKLRDENVSTVKSFAMKVKTVGTGIGLSKKLTFVAEDIQTAEEEQVETASQHWKINSSNNQIQHNNIAIDETSNYISFGTNTRIDNESIKFNTDISNDNLLTEEEDFTVITFTGKDSIENEVTSNSFDISNVMFKPSGRTDGKFHRTFDISITSQENILLYSITIIRSYLYNVVTQQKDPCDISKDIVFSYYSLNTIQNSTNHPNDGYVLNNNEIWFEIINGIEYLKASVQNNNYIKVTSI